MQMYTCRCDPTQSWFAELLTLVRPGRSTLLSKGSFIKILKLWEPGNLCGMFSLPVPPFSPSFLSAPFKNKKAINLKKKKKLVCDLGQLLPCTIFQSFVYLVWLECSIYFFWWFEVLFLIALDLVWRQVNKNKPEHQWKCRQVLLASCCVCSQGTV